MKIANKISKLANNDSSEEEEDGELIGIIFEEGWVDFSDSNDEENILKKESILRIRSKIQKMKAIKLEKILLNKDSWSENWQAELLKKSKSLKY